MGSKSAGGTPEYVLRRGGAKPLGETWRALPFQRKSSARVLGITSRCAEDWFRKWRSVRPHPAQLGVVSTSDQTRTAADSAAAAVGAVNLTVESVDGPSDLSGLGLAVDDYASAWSDGRGNPLVWITSLDPLLAATSQQEVFRFLHVVQGRLSLADGRLYAAVDPNEHDTADLETLEALFDEII